MVGFADQNRYWCVFGCSPTILEIKKPKTSIIGLVVKISLPRTLILLIRHLEHEKELLESLVKAHNTTVLQKCSSPGKSEESVNWRY